MCWFANNFFECTRQFAGILASVVKAIATATLLAIAAPLSVCLANVETDAHLRESQNFNRDWKFQLGDVAGAEASKFDDSNWNNANPVVVKAFGGVERLTM